MIALLYAKSLFMSKDYVGCFELLQNEFIHFPQFVSLLYAYGKYVVTSQGARNFIGSGIGALEECLRSQMKERHPKIRYYLGKAYV
jgi:hypothetical protein